MTDVQTHDRTAERAAMDRMAVAPVDPEATDSGVPEPHPEDPHTEERGAQERPMTEAETLQEALEDSMDASDPPAIVHPGGGDPAPSSGFDPEEEERIAAEAAKAADA